MDRKGSEWMSFRYLFFDTDIGYFLQMIPVALVAGLICFFCKRKKDPHLGAGKIAVASLFPAYLASLVCLTLFVECVSAFYYFLFYHMPPWPQGEGWDYLFSFNFSYCMEIRFLDNFRSENLGNILMFLPFGILYPLFRRGSSWKRTLLAGCLTSVVLENLQPFVGRSFDINDIILNSFGTLVSTLVFYGIWQLVHRKRNG